MSEIQDSLDQLLQVIKNAKGNERIDTYYLVKCNNSDALDNDFGDVLLHLVAIRGRFESSLAETDVNGQANSKITPIVIKNKPYDLIQQIDVLRDASTRGSSTIYLPEIFLDIIHRDCMFNSQIAAEKLVSLHYPLWQAADLGNAEVIKFMIMRGCPVDSQHPHKKYTALCKAVELMNLEMVKVLIELGADLDLADSHGMLPISYYNTWHTKREFQQTEIIKMLLDKSNLLKDLPQEDVARQFRKPFWYGDKEVMKMLLEYRDDILNIRVGADETPLHFLCVNPHADITEVLRGRKIDVNVRDALGRTPLYTGVACGFCHTNTFRFLLENGADVNARRTHSQLEIPLFYMCQRSITKERYFKIIEVFLEYNLDIQFVGSNQRTVFDIIKDYKSDYMA